MSDTSSKTPSTSPPRHSFRRGLLSASSSAETSENERSASPLSRFSAEAVTTLSLASHQPLLPTPTVYFDNGMSTVETIPDECRRLSLSLYQGFRQLEHSDLEFGVRMERIANLFSQPISESPLDFCDGLLRVLWANEGVSGEAKAAALRYLGIYDTPLDTSALTNLFLSALDRGSDLETTAAARSLADIGDAGAIPAIKQASYRSSSMRAKHVMEEAIKTIEGSDDTIPRTQA